MAGEAADMMTPRERRRLAEKGTAGRRASGLGIMVLNLAMFAGAALFLVAVDASARRRVEAETLRSNSFLTTEWRLMKELKDRTDQQLRDKDLEIAELRKRYLSLKESGSPIELLEAIENEMLRAEAEREAILSTRLMAVSVLSSEPSAAAPASIAAAPPSPVSGAGRSGGSETALSELLRARIQGLEESLRSSLTKEAAVNLELEGLRKSIVELEAASAARTPEEVPAAIEGPVDRVESGGSVELVDSMLAALAEKKDSVADPDAVLGISDLKTRAVLRAIVRTPVIRSEYPDLQEAFDRYLALAGKAEYLRGLREAYAEVTGTLELLKGGQEK